MTALPEYRHPLTAAGYAALPEDEGGRYELQEGWVTVYWMIDLNDGPSLVACHLAGELGYQNGPPARGVYVAADAPVPLRADLAALLD